MCVTWAQVSLIYVTCVIFDCHLVRLVFDFMCEIIHCHPYGIKNIALFRVIRKKG